MVRYRIEVRGVVQGVGFRWFTRRVAGGLGLTGFVQNLDDGSVLCETEGDAPQLASLLEQLRRGPSGACVDEVVWREVAAAADRGFEVRR